MGVALVGFTAIRACAWRGVIVVFHVLNSVRGVVYIKVVHVHVSLFAGKESLLSLSYTRIDVNIHERRRY